MTPTTIGENELRAIADRLREASDADRFYERPMNWFDADMIVTELLARRSDGLGTVSVKPLEWTPSALVKGMGLVVRVANTAFGEYRVVKGSQGLFDGYRNFAQVTASYREIEGAEAACQSDFETRVKSCLTSIGVEAGKWQTIDSADRSNGVVIQGWGEYRERDGFSPAYMRWYDDEGGWTVNGMPFYPTHWQPLPAAPGASS